MIEKTTRKDLLKQGAAAFAVLAAGGLLPAKAFSKGSKKSTETLRSSLKFDEVFDVIVVGSGLAGSVAAITAAKKGDKVLLIEKMSMLGGSSAKQEFHLACPGSKEQKQNGIKDSPEFLLKDIQKVGENYGNSELIGQMTKNSIRFYDLLVKTGIQFQMLKELRGHSVSRTLWHADGGKGVLERLHSFLNGKCEIRLQVKVDEVLIDESGHVMGVKVREQYVSTNRQDDDLINTSGVVKHYGAKKGVILANGGFAFDKAFISGEAKYFGGLSEKSASAHPGSTAGLLKSLILKGAHPVNMSLYHLSYPLYERDYYYGLMVDAAGLRLADEGSPNKFGRIAVKSKNKNDNKPPICIFDTTGFELLTDKQRRDAAVRAGKLKIYASIEQISNDFHIPLPELNKTIEDYHQTIDAKKDEVFMKMVGELEGAAVKKAPFYAIAVEPEINSTTGGLYIDKKARVLRMADGKPFIGLYAAGEAAGGVHGAQILEGLCTLDCGTFGIIAGEQVSKLEAVNFQ